MQSLVRVSASSYSNTAPLIWSFLYGPMRGSAELILDNAPARSAELLTQDRVDAALVPVIASQFIDGVSLYPDVCVGAEKRVRSVILVTDGRGLEDVRSVALDVSSRTSVVLTNVIFREFLGSEPEWHDAPPDIGSMLATADAALLIGDPALRLSTSPVPDMRHRVFDLVELWHSYTGLGFVFAMWMTRRGRFDIDLARARDHGVEHIDDIALNYSGDLGLPSEVIAAYLSDSISYTVSEQMRAGMELYFELAARHGLIDPRPLCFAV